MTMTADGCGFDSAQLSDYVDGDLDAAGTRLVETHVAGCDACRVLLADLSRIAHEAAAWPAAPPPARLRMQVLARLDHEAARAARPAGGRATAAQWWVAAAAALVVAASGLWMVRRQPAVPQATVASAAAAAHAGETSASSAAPAVADAGRATTADTVTTVVEELKMAEDHYQKAINGLQAITSRGQEALDPAVSATLQKNLAVIDRAIAESRAAVKKEPGSQPAQDSLIEAFRSKLSLLQDTVTLINEMRKGHSTETAKIIQTLKSS